MTTINHEVHRSAIDLGPELPLAVFTSTERWHSDRVGALAVYCSDGRWGEAFDEFCHKHLQIPRYDRWAVPGGPAWLAADGDSNREQLDFLVEIHKLEQIVLITHFGCAYYAHRMQQGLRNCLPEQVEDVHNAMNNLRSRYPKMHLTSYLAMRTGNCLSFHEITGDAMTLRTVHSADSRTGI